MRGAPLLAAALLATTALAGPGPAVAQGTVAVTVTARASSTEVSVGQQFTVAADVSGPAGATYTFPASAGDGKVEVRLAPPPADAPPPPNRRTYLATAFVLEDAAVPPHTVSYRLPDGAIGTATSQAIPLHIVSLLSKDPEGQKPADIRPPVQIPIGAPFYVACGVAAALIAALVVLLLRRRRHPADVEIPSVPPLPPDVEALSVLERLAASGLLEEERFKEFYVTLAETTKRYLERRLGAAVLEMTSSETIAFLRDHDNGWELLPAVRDLVHTADFVKFARGAAAVETGKRHMAAVRGMVRSLEARLSAVEAVAPAAKSGEEAA